MSYIIHAIKVEIELPERIDSLEKTPEGMTLLEAIEAKLVYDSSDEDENDGDDDEVEDLAIQKDNLKICNKSERQTKPSKKIARDLLLSAGEKIKTEKEGYASYLFHYHLSRNRDAKEVSLPRILLPNVRCEININVFVLFSSLICRFFFFL